MTSVHDNDKKQSAENMQQERSSHKLHLSRTAQFPHSGRPSALKYQNPTHITHHYTQQASGLTLDNVQTEHHNREFVKSIRAHHLLSCSCSLYSIHISAP